jgi:hypothetical protein
MEPYVIGKSGMWRVECVKCGAVDEGRGPVEARVLQDVLGRQMCNVISLSVRADRAGRAGPGATGLHEAQVLALWSGQDLPQQYTAVGR